MVAITPRAASSSSSSTSTSTSTSSSAPSYAYSHPALAASNPPCSSPHHPHPHSHVSLSLAASSSHLQRHNDISLQADQTTCVGSSHPLSHTSMTTSNSSRHPPIHEPSCHHFAYSVAEAQAYSVSDASSSSTEAHTKPHSTRACHSSSSQSPLSLDDIHDQHQTLPASHPSSLQTSPSLSSSTCDLSGTNSPPSQFSPPSTPSSPVQRFSSLKAIHKTATPHADPEAWRSVCENIKQMDSLYDATFYTWLKSEENVVVTSVYLHRIANQYPLVRIINALKWLICDWRLESIGILVKHITLNWRGEQGDVRRATLLRHLTHNWAPQYVASLIASVLSSAPYTPQNHSGKTALQTTVMVTERESGDVSKERFLKQLTCDYDFSKLSEFLIQLSQPTTIATGGPTVLFQKGGACTHSFSQTPYMAHNVTATTTIVIDYKIKVAMLKDAARREKELAAKGNAKSKAPSLDEEADDLAAVPMSQPRRAPATPQPSVHRHVVVQHPDQLHNMHPHLSHHRSSQNLYPQRSISSAASSPLSPIALESCSSSAHSSSPPENSADHKRQRLDDHDKDAPSSKDDGHSTSSHMRRRSSLRRRRNSFCGGMEIDKMEVDGAPESNDGETDVTTVNVDMDMGVASVATNGTKGKESEGAASVMPENVNVSTVMEGVV